MKIILNRDVKNVGKVGEVREVSDGYGRNFLLPKGYAVVATKANIAQIESKLAELKEKNAQAAKDAVAVAELLSKEVFNTVRQAADDNTIYGSIRTKDVYNLIKTCLSANNNGFDFDIGGINIATPIKALGQYVIPVCLFGDVFASIRLNVCRNQSDFESDTAAFDKKMQQALAVAEKKNAEKVEAKEEKKEEVKEEQPKEEAKTEAAASTENTDGSDK